jgi:repressor LexA
MKRLSGKTIEIYEFLKAYHSENLKPPSVREIAKNLRIPSTSTVHYHLKKLEKAGLIRLEKNKSRNIQLLSNPGKRETYTSLPVLGRIKAGYPAISEENIERYLSIPEELAGKADFALRISGDSMKNAGILDGDLVLVKQTPVINPGEIGVFLLDGEATIKRFEIVDEKPALVPENPEYQVIFPKELSVIGRVVLLIREY